MSEDKKDGVDKFFDWVDRGVDKYVNKMSEVSTPEKEEAEHSLPTPSKRPPPDVLTAPRKQLADPDIVIVDSDDSQAILKALDESAKIWQQRASAEALPERSRALHRANAVAAESIAEELREKLSRGYHIVLKR